MSAIIDLDETTLAQGLLALVISLVEIIKDALKLQAFRRMEGGGLSHEEMERLGRALADLDNALAQIKRDQGIAGAVQQVRDDLDGLVQSALDQFLNPEAWAQESQAAQDGRAQRW